MEKFLDIIAFCVLVVMPILIILGVWISVARGVLILLGSM